MFEDKILCKTIIKNKNAHVSEMMKTEIMRINDEQL